MLYQEPFMNIQTFIQGGQNHLLSEVQTDLDLVRDIQHNLARLGFNPGATNGIWTPKTQDALTRFKAAHRLFSNDFTIRLAQVLLQPNPTAERSPCVATKAVSVTASQHPSQGHRQAVSPPPPSSRVHRVAPPPPPSFIAKASSHQAGKPCINRDGLNIIKECEGLTLEATLCLGGLPIIGYSSVQGTYLGQTITSEQAETLLLKSLKRVETAVNHLVKVPLSSNQFSALISFVSNVGYAAFQASTLLRVLNQGNYEEAANQFLRWDNANGKIWPELTKRRQLERALFLK
jgi:GH24 family phage-related lysozyme (muramidase)